MATIYKRTRRKPIPQDAEITQRDGKRFVVWFDRGRRRRAPLADDERGHSRRVQRLHHRVLQSPRSAPAGGQRHD